MADKNIRRAWTVTTSYTTVVTPEELPLVLLEALPAPAPDRAMWDQDITNASPQELADLAADLPLSRTAPAFENWPAARASNTTARPMGRRIRCLRDRGNRRRPD